MSNQYVILPMSDDLNRGDQALVWQTFSTIKKIDNHAECFAIANDNHFIQSKKIGINPLKSVLLHPSRRYKDSYENISYDFILKLKWGMCAFVDFAKSVLLLNRVSRKLGIRFLDADQRKTLDTISSAKGVYVKGGGFMHSYGGVAAPYKIYYTLFHILLAQSLKRDVFIMPNSFGPFRGLFVKSIIKRVIRKSKKCYCRESLSTKSVKKDMNISLTVFPDLGFLIDSLESTNSMKTKLFASNQRPKVAVTARPYRFPEHRNGKELYDKYLVEMGKFAGYLVNQGYQVIFVEHTRAIREHESDISAIRKIMDLVPQEHTELISNESYDCRDLKRIYSLCDYVVGTRFHSDIFAMSEGVPVIAISYEGHKSAGIMSDVGLSEYCLNMDSVNFEKLVETFESLVKNERKIKEKINQYNKWANSQYATMVKDIML